MIVLYRLFAHVDRRFTHNFGRLCVTHAMVTCSRSKDEKSMITKSRIQKMYDVTTGKNSFLKKAISKHV